MTIGLGGVLALSGAGLQAADWPQWRGLDRTAVSKETGLLKSWPAGGPRLVWTGKNLGEGHSTPSVAAGRVYGMGLRGNDEVVWCIDEKSGSEVWATRIAGRTGLDGRQGGEGSRCTPTVDGNLLYVLGVAGDLTCLKVADGKPVWQKSLVSDFGGRIPTWGYSESPLIDGNKVIATPGSRANTIIALNKLTGEPIWRSAIQPGGAGYSSAIIADVEGQKQYIQFLAGGVVGVNAADGQLAWRYDNPANRQGINCSTPIYRDGHVFAASAYGNGGGLAKVTKNSATETYFTKQMQNHHGGMVVVGDHLYGFDQSNLTCLDFKTGDVKWTDRSVGKGSVAFADGMIYARGERQGIALLEATPNGYVEKSRFDQPNRSNAPAWPHPVIANGRLYLRDQDVLLCYDLRQGSASR